MLKGDLMEERSFKYIRFKGRKVSPRNFYGREPRYEEIYNLHVNRQIIVESRDYLAIEIEGVIVAREEEFKETIWISKETYNYAKNILKPKEIYYIAHEGVSFDVSRGAWRVIGRPKPVKCPPGYKGECVFIETRLSRELGMGPFIIERKFLFKGISGEHIKKGKIEGCTYVVLAYDRDRGRFLTLNELMESLLYKNYLSKTMVRRVLESTSRHMRREWWYVERMQQEVLAPYKVVWRDVAREFIPAIDLDGSIPDHNVHYIVADTLEEAYYLMAILLAPQVNAVVRELSPWIGHVQPRFIRYFRIPKYNPSNKIHIDLMNKGKDIYQRGFIDDKDLEEIELLIEKL